MNDGLLVSFVVLSHFLAGFNSVVLYISRTCLCWFFSIMFSPNVLADHLFQHFSFTQQQLNRQSDKLPHQFRDQEEADKLLHYNLCFQRVINEAKSQFVLIETALYVFVLFVFFSHSLFICMFLLYEFSTFVEL